LLLASGCEESPPQAKFRSPNNVVVFVPPSDGVLSEVGVIAGAARAAEACAALSLVVEPIEPADLAERILRHNPSAVCLYVGDSEESAALVPRMLDARVLTVVIDYETGPALDPRITGRVRIDWAGAAEHTSRALQELASRHKSYILLHPSHNEPPAGGPPQQAAAKSATGRRVYEQFLSLTPQKYPLWRLTEVALPPQRLEELPVRAERMQSLIRDALNQFGSCRLVVSLCPHAMFSGESNRSANGVAPGETSDQPPLQFLSLGAGPRTWPLMREGRAAMLVGALDPRIGDAAMALAVCGLTGDTVESRERFVSFERVSPEGLSAFVERYYVASGGQEALERVAAARAGASGLRPSQRTPIP
jgi:hypothetical protein